MLSAAVKLAEGPDFVFGARWALLQYHAWSDRRRSPDMEDTAVKEYFRAWMEKPERPWYVYEQYTKENLTRLRGVRRQSERQA